MPVTDLKFQLEFQMGEANWSEVYYASGSDPKAAESVGISLARERLKFLVPVAKCHHIRISAAQPGGRSYRFPLLNPSGAFSASDLRDVGSVTATIGVYAGSSAFRKLKFHGLPDSSNRFLADGSEDTGVTGLLGSFVDYLIAQHFEIKHVAVPAREATRVVTAINVGANGVVTFVCDAAGLVNGQKIRVSSGQGYHAAQFNGVWTIGAVIVGPPAGVQCASRRYIDPNYFYVGSSAKIRDASVAGYSFLPITSRDNYQQGGTRRVGRPTNSPRGRSSSRR